MRRRIRWWAVACAAVAAASAVVASVLFLTAGNRSSTVAISSSSIWDSAPNRSCSSARPNSVICVSGAFDIAGLGRVEYVRDAVSTGASTSDGCPEYTTQGTLWISGGSATLTGRPASTCGADDSPDAHYLYTVTRGAGLWANASGHGEILADHGKDVWTGTLSAPSGTGGGHASRSTSRIVLSGVLYGIAAAGAAVAIVLFTRRRIAVLQPEDA